MPLFTVLVDKSTKSELEVLVQAEDEEKAFEIVWGLIEEGKLDPGKFVTLAETCDIVSVEEEE